MTNIKATVIIAAWNAQAELSRSVHSALAQRNVSLEVIVVDDASADDTALVAGDLAAADPRVRLVRLAANGGPGAARNAAIDTAKGDWIAILDADDTMRPDRLAKMIGEGEAVDADAIFDDFQAVDPCGEPLGGSHLAPLALSAPERWDLARFLEGCQARPDAPSLGYLKPVLRASFLNRTGLRYDPSLRNGEDFHLIAELLARGGHLRVLPTVGYLYTRRPGSVSARLRPDHARALAKADWAFLDRYDLVPLERSLLLSRRRRLDDLTAVEDWMAQLRAGRIDRMLLGLGRRPRAAGRFAHQLVEGVSRRLRR
ncbi:MAG: glycosyltransferase family 2 protein [Pseudomonadota bacterium]